MYSTTDSQQPIALGLLEESWNVDAVELSLQMLEQKREVAVATIDAESFASGIKIDDAAVKAFFDQLLAVARQKLAAEKNLN